MNPQTALNWTPVGIEKNKESVELSRKAIEAYSDSIQEPPQLDMMLNEVQEKYGS